MQASVGIAHAYYVLNMQECLTDIEHAIHHGYVITSQEDKLMKRREKCLAKQRQNKKTSKVSSKRAEEYSDLRLFNAFESEHVIIQSNHTCGRYIEVYDQNLLSSLHA